MKSFLALLIYNAQSKNISKFITNKLRNTLHKKN